MSVLSDGYLTTIRYIRLTLWKWSRNAAKIDSAPQDVPPITVRQSMMRSWVRSLRVPQSLETDGLWTTEEGHSELTVRYFNTI